MQVMRQRLQQALAEKRVLKLIAGIDNFDAGSVVQLAQAAQVVSENNANALLALDVAAQPELIRAAKAVFGGPVFASGVNPEALQAAVKAGADAVELGNFDALYAAGYFISAEEVLRLSRETKALVGEAALLSITVPGHLSTQAQVELVRALEVIGVDVIQTEGATRMLSATPVMQELSAAEKAVISLRNTQALVRATSIPVMTASGITADTIAQAFASGAAAVGVGKSVRLATCSESEAAILALVEAMAAVRQLSAVS